MQTREEILKAGQLNPGYYYVLVDIEDDETRKKLNATPNIRALRGGEVNLDKNEVLIRFQVLEPVKLKDSPLDWFASGWGALENPETDGFKSGVWEHPGKTFIDVIDELDLPNVGDIAEKAVSNIIKPIAIGLGILLGLAILSKLKK